jgi:hypothetical protein
MAQPVDEQANLKFKFYVPAHVEIEYRGPDKESAARALALGLERGEAVLHIRSLRELRFDTFKSEDWDAEVQWTCPECGEKYWFDLRKRNCYGTCTKCKIKYVVIEGYAYWFSKKCDSCPKRLECLLIPRLDAEYATDKKGRVRNV